MDEIKNKLEINKIPFQFTETSLTIKKEDLIKVLLSKAKTEQFKTIFEKMIENLQKNISSTLYYTFFTKYSHNSMKLYSIINMSFPWQATNEGRSYWARLYDYYSKREKNIDILYFLNSKKIFPDE